MTSVDPGDRLITARFALVVIVGLLYFISLGMLLPVVPPFVRDHLGGDDLAVGIAVGSFAFGAVVLRPFAGRIGDSLGRRVLIVGGAALVGAAAVLYHFVDGVPELIVYRVIGGIGEAAFFVGAGTMVTDLAPVARRGEAISYWSVSVYGGLAFGPFLGDLIHRRGGYGWVWSTAAGFAVAAAVLGVFTRETLTAPSVAAGAAPRTRAPLLHRSSLAPGIVLFLGLVGLAGFFGFVPLYVQDLGMDGVGGVLVMYGLIILVVRIAGAKVPDRIGPLAAGTIATGVGGAGLLVIALVGNPIGLYAGTAVFAVGMSFLYPSLLMLALTGVPEEERGSAVGTVSSFFDLSQGLGAAMLGAVASLGGYRWSFAAGAGFAFLGLVLLRSGIDRRTSGPVDKEAARAARQAVEPDVI